LKDLEFINNLPKLGKFSKILWLYE